MLFRDLKAGYPIYIFDRGEVKVSQGKVVDRGVPRLDPRCGTTDMVVDVTIEHDGQTKTYTFKETTDVGYINNLVISIGRECILHEVEVMKTQSEQALAQVETHKSNVEKCTEILANLNPALKEKQETEARFSKLENSMSEMMNMMKGLVKELKG